MAMNYLHLAIGIVLIAGAVPFLLSFKKPELANKLFQVLGTMVGLVIVGLSVVYVLNSYLNREIAIIDTGRSVTAIAKKQVKTIVPNVREPVENTTFILKDGRKIKAYAKSSELGQSLSPNGVNLELALRQLGTTKNIALVKATFIRRVPSAWVPFQYKSVTTTGWVSLH